MSKIHKTAYFYKINYNNNLIQQTPNLFDNINNIEINRIYDINIGKTIKDNIKIQIYSFDKTYLFGICFKPENLKDSFLRKVDKIKNVVGPFELNEYEHLETFTYFCIKFKNDDKWDRMISISNNKIKSITKIIERFITSICNISNIEIVGESIEDLDKKLNNAKFTKVNLTLFNDKIENNIPSLKDTLLENHLIKNLSLSVTLNNNKNIWSKIKNLFYCNNYKNMSLVYQVDGLEETLDLVKNTYTKKISLDIEKGSELNQNQIFEILKKYI